MGTPEGGQAAKPENHDLKKRIPAARFINRQSLPQLACVADSSRRKHL
jgi:hypothetical protein